MAPLISAREQRRSWTLKYYLALLPLVAASKPGETRTLQDQDFSNLGPFKTEDHKPEPVALPSM
ncbi:hypothetical protein PHLCEN_2v11163 [Hermanssonia centrifuga]|uniref:Uncharacterized protein n=1 Tax=Hermanssonia centrifuga TaxID=98765 RepID=A0A2R6NL47_9APHY|nr:hypothetical protein PHLCEN_2v11163 [Hermanssonia centrifuga]